MVLRVIARHLTILTALMLAVLFIIIPTIVILGILTLILQRRMPAGTFSFKKYRQAYAIKAIEEVFISNPVNYCVFA
jgi:hypothetical protein